MFFSKNLKKENYTDFVKSLWPFVVQIHKIESGF